MARGLNFGRDGGELTGSGLGLEGPPEPAPVSIGSSPISEFSGMDKLKFILASGLGGMGGGPNTFLASRNAAIKAQTAKGEAEEKRNIKIVEMFITAGNSARGIKDTRKRIAFNKGIAERLGKIDPEARKSWEIFADEPSVVDLATNPARAEDLKAAGGLSVVLPQLDGTPAENKALRNTVAGIHRSVIHEKIRVLKDEFSKELTFDANKDGDITEREIASWSVRHEANKNIPEANKLDINELNVFNSDVFEEDRSVLFDIKTRAGVVASLEKGEFRKSGNVITQQGIFPGRVTQDGSQEIQRDPGGEFTPVNPEAGEFFTTTSIAETGPGALGSLATGFAERQKIANNELVQNIDLALDVIQETDPVGLTSSIKRIGRGALAQAGNILPKEVSDVVNKVLKNPEGASRDDLARFALANVVVSLARARAGTRGSPTKQSINKAEEDLGIRLLADPSEILQNLTALKNIKKAENELLTRQITPETNFQERGDEGLAPDEGVLKSGNSFKRIRR